MYKRQGLGTWGMAGSFWGKVDDDQSIATIRAGLEAGINLIDTAPVYGDGHSEEVVGKALEGLKREDIVLATKCGRFTCETEKIRQELETSLKRLKTDYIDLYQVHWPDDKVPFEETFGELENMRKQGKIQMCIRDRITFKSVVKTAANRNGLHASFMPKPMQNQSGSGLHLHLSLFKQGQNIFKNEKDVHSPQAEGFIQGILERISEITAFSNPLVNSYVRFGEDEAPKYITWSHENRSQLIRIPPATGQHCLLYTSRCV